MYKLHTVILPFLLLQQINCDPKLNVEVFYESLCPDSYNFITEQLSPVFRDLAPYVDLTLIPFGKSASIHDKEIKFICQHGPNECRGNKIQSCVLAKISDSVKQVDYVNCFMNYFAREHLEQGQKCAEAAGVDFNEITKCYKSSAGTDLQLAAEQRTVEISPKFIPTIVYNKKFDQQLQDESIADFRHVVCNIITQTYPQACNSPSIIRL